MITDTDIKQDIQMQWDTIRKMAYRPESVSAPYGSRMGIVVVSTPTAPPDYLNLPFVLAYSVLDSVLNELVRQQVFMCKDWKLGTKMTASQVALHWQDYSLVKQGKKLRNDLAHGARLLDRAECLKYIRSIEAELIAWGVIS